MNNESFIEKSKLTKLEFWSTFIYNNLKYCEFIKIDKSEILFYMN